MREAATGVSVPGLRPSPVRREPGLTGGFGLGASCLITNTEGSKRHNPATSTDGLFLCVA